MTTPNELGWVINWPRVDLSVVVSFSFSVSLPDGTFAFRFTYLNGGWTGWVTMPDGSVRTMGCVPNVPSWTGYAGYAAHQYVVALISDAVALGQPDLLKATLAIARMW